MGIFDRHSHRRSQGLEAGRVEVDTSARFGDPAALQSLHLVLR